MAEHRVTAYILAEGPSPRPHGPPGDLPAVMSEALGRPLLYHLLDGLSRASVVTAVVCGRLAGEVRRQAGERYRNIRLEYGDEHACKGPADAVLAAMHGRPDGYALVFTAPVAADADIAAALSWFSGREHQAAFLAPALSAGTSGPGPRGPVMDPAEVCAGAYLLRPRALADLPVPGGDGVETALLAPLARAGTLGVFPPRERFLDTPAWSCLRAPHSPRPAAARSAVFLDRDGTIIVERHYLHDPAGVELLPGAAEGLRRMRALGLPLIVVSNQSGIGRGYFGRKDVERVHGRLIELLEPEGVTLDAFHICPHAPDAGCRCRKPGTGLVLRAGSELGIDPRASFVVGDKPCDIDLGRAAGATTFLVTTGYGKEHIATSGAHHVVNGLAEAACRMESILADRNAEDA